MTLPVVLRQSAIKELNSAYRWYESEREGLGREFLADFKQLAKSIEDFPQSFVRINDKIRRASLNRFPYMVFYRVESKRIIVLSVLHQARDPHTWPLPRKRSR